MGNPSGGYTNPYYYTNPSLAGAQTPTNCSSARHLVGKMVLTISTAQPICGGFHSKKSTNQPPNVLFPRNSRGPLWSGLMKPVGFPLKPLGDGHPAFNRKSIYMGVSYNSGAQQPLGFPTKNHHFGVWNGGTAISGNTHITQLRGGFKYVHFYPEPWGNDPMVILKKC